MASDVRAFKMPCLEMGVSSIELRHEQFGGAVSRAAAEQMDVVLKA
jgi:hypothetical protein